MCNLNPPASCNFDISVRKQFLDLGYLICSGIEFHQEQSKSLGKVLECKFWIENASMNI